MLYGREPDFYALLLQSMWNTSPEMTLTLHMERRMLAGC